MRNRYVFNAITCKCPTSEYAEKPTMVIAEGAGACRELGSRHPGAEQEAFG